MIAADLIIRGARVVLPARVAAASIHVRDGRIAAVREYAQVPQGAVVVEAGESVIMPGLVDTHVHINDPGRSGWEGFATATRAAAAGGVTTLIDMPLNSIPPTTTVEGLRAKQAAARGICSVDVGFWGGLVPGNQGELAPLLAAGAVGFKSFLAPSGVEEFPHVAERDLRRAMPELASLGAVLLAHAELPGPLASAQRALDSGSRSYTAYLRSRPPAAEVEAIQLLIRLCHEIGARVHIVHLSAAEALPLLFESRREGLPISVETCPHYLHFAAEEIPDGAPQYKCAPPIRGRGNRERLWEALGEGLIEMVVSDHSPCPPAMKELASGDLARAWGGISSLQLGPAVIWQGMRARGFPVERLAQWMSAAPARLAGIERRKGAIAVGQDADLVVWDPDAEFVVEPRLLHHRHPLTPYAGARLAGVVEMTFLRGEKVYDHGEFAERPAGRILRRDSE